MSAAPGRPKQARIAGVVEGTPVSAVDLVIVGAGPAGLAAGVAARELGLSVILLDDQEAPGGQIYRNIEDNLRRCTDAGLGADYLRGAGLVRRFRDCGAQYLARSMVWQVDADGSVYYSRMGRSHRLAAACVLLATGAMERPPLAPGWTLPGVMTVGAAQIMQKTAQALPAKDVWIAGCGPLALYYAASLARQGVRLAGFLDTAVPSNRRVAVRHWAGALRRAAYLAKGVGYLARLRLSSVPYFGGVTALEIQGEERVQAIRWKSRHGWQERPAQGVLLHEGVVPHTQLAQAIGCAHVWDEHQACFRPVVGTGGVTSIDRILVAGDCAGIGGARAAELQGRLAAGEAAARLGRLGATARVDWSADTERQLVREMAIRPFLDALYLPREEVRLPPDVQLVCRCESVTAGQVREAVRSGCRTVDGVKSQLRCGMGPCQGRVCGLPVAALVADERDIAPDAVGPLRLRPPIRPISLDELAHLAVASEG
ncbi:FAD/NAD(P)-dependent oxidoreductase [Hydrogenophaga sp. BPS33]|uniref:FAD/NAD(P)-dependent oxidoreductase n=1 Tax=Hydrogenophaga sp. BPS33 TaxID=2651974 RepID=UPI00135CF4F3|nr:NAD(P)/FAD-dependent oxidoreductase [Hydrogenophaga sp. BPS33]